MLQCVAVCCSVPQIIEGSSAFESRVLSCVAG